MTTDFLQRYKSISMEKGYVSKMVLEILDIHHSNEPYTLYKKLTHRSKYKLQTYKISKRKLIRENVFMTHGHEMKSSYRKYTTYTTKDLCIQNIQSTVRKQKTMLTHEQNT